MPELQRTPEYFPTFEEVMQRTSADVQVLIARHGLQNATPEQLHHFCHSVLMEMTMADLATLMHHLLRDETLQGSFGSFVSGYLLSALRARQAGG